ncbi:MAG: ATP-binding protein [Calditrichia bacterium]
MAITELKTKDLQKNIKLQMFPFETTDDIKPLDSIIGQERAIRAIELALEIDHTGYNVFVTGMSGTGRTTIVNDILKNIASGKPRPNDWIYVFNFEDPDAPQAIELPAGKGKAFQNDMAELIKSLKKDIPETFDSEEYEKQNTIIINKYNEQKRNILTHLDAEAKALGIQIQSSPSGYQTIVLKGNEPMKPEDYEKLSDAQKEEIEKNLAKIQERIDSTVRDLVKLDRQAAQDIRDLNEKIANYLVSRYINEIKHEYHEFEQINEYLNKVSKDVITNINEFLSQTRKESEKENVRANGMNHFKRYHVNVVVDNSGTEGAPVIYEPNPTYNNLFGRIEKQMIMGAQVTDFTMIKGGSLHKANGGYLMTEAFHVLNNPYVYDALKRAIKTREIRVEDVAGLSGYLSPAGLRPQTIPLNLKVILIGWNQIYYTLQSYDQDFSKIFKVRADFDYETNSTKDSILKYAHFIRKVCDEEKLFPFHRSAVREVVYYGHRLVDDQEKISLRFGSLVSVIREATYFSRKDGQNIVRAQHVQKAISEYEYRHSMVQEKIQEMYKRNIYRIDTGGEKVGQINGLSVYSLGEHSFGRPARITAKTYIGTENVVNIERKARLSGKIHDKGLLILSGFFNSKFGEYIPLAFSASLTFEQSYSMIDGDSASSTELYALISSLSGVPLKQGIAVTGSVNQNGEIQAIGGVNQKIEGFFEVCREKGLNGEQGVMIPASNIDNLNLKSEIIDAVRKKKFNIWAVESIEDGLKVLTGKEAGSRLRNRRFPRGSLYCLVEHQLRAYSKRASDFRKSLGETKKKSGEKEDSSKNGNNGED